MKRIIKKTLTLAAIMVFGIAALAGCSGSNSGQEDTFAKIEDRGYVIMGLDDTFAPMGFRDTQEIWWALTWT